MKIIVSNLSSQIETDNPKLLNSLITLYTFSVPGAFYAKCRRWNGKKSFISPTGKFKTGLLNRVLEDLKRIDLVPEIEYLDNDKNLDLSLDFNLPNKELRPYQKELISLAFKAKRALIKSPTGSGKTLLIAQLVNLFKDKNVLILFNKKQLLVQTYKFLTEEIGLKNVGLAFGEGFIQSNIMLCTVQSIEKIIGLPVEKPDLLLVDEVHEFSSGKFNSKVISLFPSAFYRFGFTATIPTDKIKLYNIEGAFGPVISSVSTQELISEGYLAKPNIKMISIDYNTSSLNGLSYIDLYSKCITKNISRNNIIKFICESITHPNPKIAIITQALEHATILVNLLPNAKKIEGLNSVEERNEVIDWFKSSYRPILIGTNILQTGIDIKEINYFINARGLKSDIATVQALGRSLRVDKDSEVFVYDFFDKDNGILEKHSRARIRAYKRENHKPEII